MIIFCFISLAVGLVIGYKLGYMNGETKIESRLLAHIVSSDKYHKAVEDAFAEAVMEVKRGKARDERHG